MVSPRILSFVLLLWLTPLAFAQTPCEMQYIRWQLRTASDQYLHMAWNGVATAGAVDPEDDYAKWLLIPTGAPNEYWIFNKAAQAGTGQALTLPQGVTNFGQWDFLGDDHPDRDRQKFTMKVLFVNNALGYKLVLKHNGEAVSTRWNSAAFTWSEVDNDEQQLFVLNGAESAQREDMLVSYLFWNTDNDTIRDYIADKCGGVPGPQLLRVNEMVFINNTSHTITPAVHRFGCGGIPWRAGRAQCWYEHLTPEERKTTLVIDHYLRNADEIWGLIGKTTLAVVGIVAMAATAGGAGPIVGTSMVAGTMAAAKGIATALATQDPIPVYKAGGKVAGNTAGGMIPVGNIAVFVYDTFDIINQFAGMKQTDGTQVDPNEAMTAFGYDREIAPDLTSEFGPYVLGVKGEFFEALMEKWYIEETESQRAFDRMLFSGGTAIFVFEE